MPTELPIAAIDAGSNGIRLIIGHATLDGRLTGYETWRESVRLGEDAFTTGTFSAQTIDRAVKTFQRFRQLIDEHDVGHLRAVATSACREASNRRELTSAIAAATGIRLEVISGIEEAQLVFTGVAQAVDLENRSALLIDMGGGSVELTVARDGVALGCETLRLGPVRLLTRLRAENRSEIDAEAMLTRYRGVFRSLVDSALDTPPTLCIGTGGNIERMAKLRVQLLGKTKFGKIKLEDLDPIIDHVLAMSIPMRIERLELRPDRADVIGIALLVLRMVLRDAGVTRLLVPGVGLKEGLLQQVARSASALRT